MASSSTVAPAAADEEDGAMKQQLTNNEPPPPYSPGGYDQNQMTMYGTNYVGPAGQQSTESYPMQTYPMTTQQTTAVLVNAQPIPSSIHYGFRDSPVALVCPYCNTSVITVLRYEIGAMTWTIFAGLMICLCWLCFWIPFVSNGCKDVAHICPSCSKILGVYRRF